MTDEMVTHQWFDGDPQAVAAMDAFKLIVERGDPHDIIVALDAVWAAVDRGALWASSHRLGGTSAAESLAVSTCSLMLPVLGGHLRAVAALGRAGFDHLPTAMAASRTSFELGLRIAWVFEAPTFEEAELRSAGLHHESSIWRSKVATRLDLVGGDGARWRDASEKQAGLVKRYTSHGTVLRVPNVYEQLRLLDLERLYFGYQLASEYVHGGLGSGTELAVIRAETSPFGTYWPQDWQLAVNLCAWACLFVFYHAGDHDSGPGPVKGVMWASELLLLAPGHPDPPAGSH